MSIGILRCDGCGHQVCAHECGLCQVVLNESEIWREGTQPIFCPCPYNVTDDDEDPTSA